MWKALVITCSLVIFHSLYSQVSSVDTLIPGEMLNSSAFLVSAGKVFTLGFGSSVDWSYSETNKSYLGIWYAHGTFLGPSVWLANRDMPVYNKSGILTISSSGKLMIMRDGADPIELYAAESGTNITATLLDSGNFVVKKMYPNGTTGREILWQSFDYPTDTLLPGMKLGVNHKTGRNWTLTSWFSETDPASGAFTLEWDPIRCRLAIRRRGRVYWTSGKLELYQNLGIWAFDHIVPDPVSFNYIFRNVTNQDEEYFTYSLFHDNNLTPEYRKTTSAWRLDYQGNIIDGSRDSIANAGLCYGYNTTYSGCKLWEQPKCRNSHQYFSYEYGGFQFGTATLLYDSSSRLSQSDCKAICWNDCGCIGFRDEIVGCSYWREKNATFIQKDYTSDAVYVLVSEASSTKTPGDKRWLIDKWMLISTPVALILLSILGSLLFHVRKFILARRRKEREVQELMTLEDCTEASQFESNGGRGNDIKQFSYASITSSTNNFSTDNKLGVGGFGPVYKGKMPRGREIAVKLLSQRSGQGVREFKTELVLMSKLQHRNLVKLLGFCIHGNEKIIVYDYLPNKSLDFSLFDQANREQLSWEVRFKIIEGIAQGLLYLHKYSRILIIHRDLKASNILLDENMNPKISDFGLARIFKQNVTEANTNKLVGTYGYMAPEYVTNGIFSVKSDIYSFGVLMLEIVSGRRNNSFHNIDGPLSLVEFAWELWEQRAELELMDTTIRGACLEDQVRNCIQVGLLCVQNRAADRPPIEDVISMLKNESKSMAMPEKPAFVLRDGAVQQLQRLKSKKISVNEVSLSAADGR